MFWLGVAEGLNQQLDRNLQREIWLGKENKEAQSRLIKARASTLAAIVGGRAKEESELKENVRVIAAFEERLSGLESPEEREAYLNKLKEDPDYAKGLLGQITKFEEDSGKGVRLENEKLVEMYDLIEQTRPSEMSREAYAAQVAGTAVDMAAGIKHYDSLYAGVLDSKTDTLEELAMIEQQANSGWNPEGNLGLPDGDFSGINMPADETKAIGDLFVATARAEFDRTMREFHTEIEKVGGFDNLPPKVQTAYQEMVAIENQLAEGRPEEILEHSRFSAPAYVAVAAQKPGIANTIYRNYNPNAEVSEEDTTDSAVGSTVTSLAPVVASQPAPEVLTPPPLEPPPAPVAAPVAPLTDPNQTSTLTTPPPARTGGSWKDIFSRFF
jgi:hypothetical protein